MIHNRTGSGRYRVSGHRESMNTERGAVARRLASLDDEYGTGVATLVSVAQNSKAQLGKTLASWADEYGTGSDSDCVKTLRQFWRWVFDA